MEVKTSTQTILVYIKNEVGVAMPLYVDTTDAVEAIWSEVIGAKALTGGKAHNKALVYNDRRLLVTDTIASVGVMNYGTIRLETLPPSAQFVTQQSVQIPKQKSHLTKLQKNREV